MEIPSQLLEELNNYGRLLKQGRGCRRSLTKGMRSLRIEILGYFSPPEQSGRGVGLQFVLTLLLGHT